MSITLRTPGIDGVDEATRAVRSWQQDGSPIQLHPGDLGWYRRFGADAVAAAVRTWSAAGEILAVGLLDGAGLLRLALAPVAQHNNELARQMCDDITRVERGVLPAGDVAVEARFAPLLCTELVAQGWEADEPWTPLSRDLSAPVEDPGARVDVIGTEQVDVRVAVHRASFAGSQFSAERWRAMAEGEAYADARCLVAYNDEGTAVAAATVWSAGVGRPGLLEPMGVHHDHRGHGYGTAITLAAAAVLRQLGSSSASVCTDAANGGAVATYRSAGFTQLADVRDLRRRE